MGESHYLDKTNVEGFFSAADPAGTTTMNQRRCVCVRVHDHVCVCDMGFDSFWSSRVWMQMEV